MGKLWNAYVEYHRVMTFLGYPMGVIICVFEHSGPTIQNARTFWITTLAIWAPGASFVRYTLCTADISWSMCILANFLFTYIWDAPWLGFFACAYNTEQLYKRKNCTNRLFNKQPGEKAQFKGSKIVVLGNGPSLAMGKECGSVIDSMDEVVRFNNFQTKTAGLEQWTGTKTTVHFSDSMLYPSYDEYRVPGATVALSLFMDRLCVSGSYFLFRMCMDLGWKQCRDMMFDPALGWMSRDDIHNLKDTLGISKWKHPTSGILAIDWFVRHRPDPSIPLYIHGFDFFQGDQVHYYSKTEPLYERLNDLVGVTMMHEPHKEKAFVEKLVKEGKVEWLDPPEDSQGPLKQLASDAGPSCGDRLWTLFITVNRLLTTLTYPIAIPFVCLNSSPSTPQNCRFFANSLIAFWLTVSGTFYYYMFFHASDWDTTHRIAAHFLWFWMVDVPVFWSTTSMSLCQRVLSRSICTNRLFNTVDDKKFQPEFRGPYIVILGNSPSLATGEQLGGLIDEMDEVIRFNNFQAKPGPMEAWTGSKTTVHFSDSMLYPSYPEYEVPGACVVLSLFMDRLMVSLSYFVIRMGIDLAIWQAWQMMNSPRTGWVSSEDIENLKKGVGNEKWKHPTSGCLAIDWFVRNRPDKNVPVYIHGFDFFQGPRIHYYHEQEPLYERINDVIGVKMHEPLKEKSYVAQLVEDGKVRWLHDLAADRRQKAD